MAVGLLDSCGSPKVDVTNEEVMVRLEAVWSWVGMETVSCGRSWCCDMDAETGRRIMSLL